MNCKTLILGLVNFKEVVKDLDDYNLRKAQNDVDEHLPTDYSLYKENLNIYLPQWVKESSPLVFAHVA